MSRQCDETWSQLFRSTGRLPGLSRAQHKIPYLIALAYRIEQPEHAFSHRTRYYGVPARFYIPFWRGERGRQQYGEWSI